MIGKRSKVDYTAHSLSVVENEHVTIHHLKLPDTSMNSVKFINAGGVLAVTGDFGNWIFCREFHPSEKGFASEGYWREKMKISSCQEPSKYDADATEEEIKRRLKEEDISDEYREYYNSLLNFLGDGEISYMYHAFNDCPSSMDCEYVPYEKTVNFWFLCILDAFDEICTRIKTEKEQLV